MINRNEAILLYNLDNEKGRKIKLVCMKLGIRIKTVAKSGYLEPVGFLAGIREVPPNGRVYEGNGFNEEMLVLKGLEDYRLDEFLRSLKRAGIAQVQLKAVITDHNREWTSLFLYEELKKENERLKPGYTQKGTLETE